MHEGAQPGVIEIVGRTSSHFTRVVIMLAYELDVPVQLIPVYDLASLEASNYGGNPALKIPTLRCDGALLFGTENICRALALRSTSPLRIVWPEQVGSMRAQCAQEMTWHAMAAQVQLIVATYVGKIPPENGYVANAREGRGREKVREGYEGALRWLEAHVVDVRATLPPRDLSLLELTLFCLIEHIAFRPMVSLEAYPTLRAFAAEFGQRPSAMRTVYRMDRKPEA